MSQPPALDNKLVRQRFANAAANYARANVLDREVARRMAERLDLVTLQPNRVLDAGCGQGEDLAELSQRYPRAQIVGMDMALPMLQTIRTRESWLARTLREAGRLAGLLGIRSEHANLTCADLARLPFAARSFDMAWSNLALHWCNDVPAVLQELHRVIRVDGLLSFTTLGPDSLRELRAACRQAGLPGRVHGFIDMHDLGDMLVHAGFAEPVMDMERITLTYADLTALIQDLRWAGAVSALQSRTRGLVTPRQWQRLVLTYDAQRRDEADTLGEIASRLPATFEIVYGHAWRAESKHTPDGHAIVRFEPGRGAPDVSRLRRMRGG